MPLASGSSGSSPAKSRLSLATRIGRPLRWLVRIACARPALTVVLALALAAVSLVYTLTTITFSTSTRSLLPPGRPYVERYTQYEREFGDLDSIAIVVEAPSLTEATVYATRLVRRLHASGVPLKRISYRIDPKLFEGRGLLYLPKERLGKIREAVVDYQEFVEAFAAGPTVDQRAIEGVRAVIASLKRDFPEVQVGVTGKPALQNDEMVAAFHDSQRATIIAFALTLGLLLVAFLRVGKPLLMLLVLAASLCWSIGVATLVIGHLSLFSVMFISIVIGIGIDYGIYFLFRYEEELFLGRSLREAIEITAARSGPGMLLGAVTAAGTFYVLWLTDFRGVRELGFIAGTALMFAWLAMMTVFPAMLVLVDRRHATRPAVAIPRALALERIHVPFVSQLVAYPKTLALLAVALTVVSAWGLRYVQFDYNLLNLQGVGTESVIWEKRILATAGRSGFTALASAESLDELQRKQAAFRALGSVSEVDSVLLLIPDEQLEKLKIIEDFAPLVTSVRIGRPTSVNLPRLIAALEVLKRRFTIAANEAPAGDTQATLRLVAEDISRLIIKLRQADPQVSEPILTLLQNQVYRDFVRSFQRLQSNLAPRPIVLDDVPKEFRTKFVSEGGRFLLQIHPAVDIWDRAGAERFISELRSVDPEVTGTPVITYEAMHLMERAYQQGTVYAIVLVTIVTALTLRRVRETALALLPLGLGLMWAFGLMYFFGLKFTMGNVFGLPLILGAAAEYGLNIVMRFMEGRDHGGPLIARSTMTAVLVNGLTTISGFGSLMVADHRGIFGLGLLLTLGTATSLVASLIVLPVLLQTMARRAPAPPVPPFGPDPHPLEPAARGLDC